MKHFEQRQLIIELFLVFWPDLLRFDLFCPRDAILDLDLEIKQAREVYYVILCYKMTYDIWLCVNSHCHETKFADCVDYESWIINTLLTQSYFNIKNRSQVSIHCYISEYSVKCILEKWTHISHCLLIWLLTNGTCHLALLSCFPFCDFYFYTW